MRLAKQLVLILVLCGIVSAQTTFYIPMRDSVLMATNICLPPDTAEGPVPIVLNRTPYGRNNGGAFKDSLLTRGIGFVCQDTRGRGDSEGEDSLFLDNGWGERRDGYDTVEWLASQSWCNGKVGYYGGSAHGITGYLLAAANPQHLICGFVACAASDFYHHAVFPGGCYRKEQVDGWTALNGLTHIRDLLVEHFIYDEQCDRLNIFTRLDSITVPFYHIGGWYDTFLEGNVAAFCRIQDEGGIGANGNQKMLVGPWTHGAWNNRVQGQLTYPENSTWQAEPLAIEWFDHYLNDVENNIEDTSAVRVYIMGDPADTIDGNYWAEFSQWPPEDAIADSLFLHIDQTISMLPDTIDTFLTYFHDPGGPMYHTGGRNLISLYILGLGGSGPRSQFLQDISPHGVIFTSDVLDEPVKFVGRVRTKIYASSDCIDTDFMVRLVDVYPTGTAFLVFDGALKARFIDGTDHEVFMTPGEIYEFDIELGNIAVSFAAGHRIRIGISSALNDRYEPNPNTGEPFRHNTFTQIANNNVFVGPSYPSRMIFDVLPNTTSASPHEYTISSGWNLLSRPFDDAAVVTEMFPFAMPPIWAFDTETGYYRTLDSAFAGMGFWLFSLCDTVATVHGTNESDTVEITMYPGWNLFGTPSVSVPESTITEHSEILPPIFAFDNETELYISVDELIPGYGYWILAVDTVDVTLP